MTIDLARAGARRRARRHGGDARGRGAGGARARPRAARRSRGGALRRRAEGAARLRRAALGRHRDALPRRATRGAAARARRGRVPARAGARRRRPGAARRPRPGHRCRHLGGDRSGLAGDRARATAALLAHVGKDDHAVVWAGDAGLRPILPGVARPAPLDRRAGARCSRASPRWSAGAPPISGRCWPRPRRRSIRRGAAPSSTSATGRPRSASSPSSTSRRASPAAAPGARLRPRRRRRGRHGDAQGPLPRRLRRAHRRRQRRRARRAAAARAGGSPRAPRRHRRSRPRGGACLPARSRRDRRGRELPRHRPPHRASAPDDADDRGRGRLVEAAAHDARPRRSRRPPPPLGRGSPRADDGRRHRPRGDGRPRITPRDHHPVHLALRADAPRDEPRRAERARPGAHGAARALDAAALEIQRPKPDDTEQEEGDSWRKSEVAAASNADNKEGGIGHARQGRRGLDGQRPRARDQPALRRARPRGQSRSIGVLRRRAQRLPVRSRPPRRLPR